MPSLPTKFTVDFDEKVDRRFAAFYTKMFAYYINDGMHLQPRLKHSLYFLAPGNC